MRKRLLFLSLVAVCLLLIAACTAAPAGSTATTGSSEAASATESSESAEAAPAGDVVELEYWQVDFENWDTAIETVIGMFEAENPGIRINYVPVPYEEISTRLAAMIPVGQGPDLINPYFGWVPLWVKSGFLAPLPADRFPEAEIKEKYFPAVNAMYLDGELYGLPMNQNNWAILYNKDFFEEVGITELPTTLEELREAAIQCTQRDADGNLTRAGYYLEQGTQEHILWKVLIQKNGQPIFSDDLRTVTWNDSPIGLETWQWFLNLWLEDKVMDVGFGDGVAAAFYTGQTCMRTGSPGNIPVIRNNAPDLNFGLFPLPAGSAEDPNVALSNQAQYWSFNMTTKAAADPAKAEAAYKFFEFIQKPEVVKAYIEILGGLPPLRELGDDPMFTENPDLEAFLATIDYSAPLSWVDELGERQVSIDAIEKVLLNGEDPAESFEWVTTESQKLRDGFFQ